MSIFCKLNNDSYFADTNRSIATCVPNAPVQETDEAQTVPGSCKVYDFARMIQVAKQVTDGDIDMDTYLDNPDDLTGGMQRFVTDMKLQKDTNVKCGYQVNPSDNGQVSYSTTTTTGTVPRGFYSVSIKKGVNPNLPKNMETAYASRAMGVSDTNTLGALNKDLNNIFQYSLIDAPATANFTTEGTEDDEAEPAAGTSQDNSDPSEATPTPPVAPVAVVASPIVQANSVSTFWESFRYTMLIVVVVIVLIMIVMFIILVIMYSQSGTQDGGVFMRAFR